MLALGALAAPVVLTFVPGIAVLFRLQQCSPRHGSVPRGCVSGDCSASPSFRFVSGMRDIPLARSLTCSHRVEERLAFVSS